MTNTAAELLLARTTWLKHASVLYDGSMRIAIDPWEVHLDQPVDLVLVTHGHYDHCDPDTIRKILREGGAVVAAAACAASLPGDVRALHAGEVARVGNAVITAVEAYNLQKSFHPRGEGVGFLVVVDEGTLFHAGDTDAIPELKDLKSDLAFLPVGGTYTMDVPEAARAAETMGAGITVPMHYGYIVGSKEDGEQFARTASVSTRVLSPAVPFPAAPNR